MPLAQSSARRGRRATANTLLLLQQRRLARGDGPIGASIEDREKWRDWNRAWTRMIENYRDGNDEQQESNE
jgi:hypothetical protein